MAFRLSYGLMLHGNFGGYSLPLFQEKGMVLSHQAGDDLTAGLGAISLL